MSDEQEVIAAAEQVITNAELWTCPMCFEDWHVLPKYVERVSQSCPGAMASDEAKTVWQQMFPRVKDEPQLPVLENKPPAPWRLTGRIFANLTRDTFKIALFTRGSNLEDTFTHGYSYITNEVSGGGYTTGGQPVLLCQAETGDVWFSRNPTWRTTRHGFTAYYAMIYDAATDAILCYTSFGPMTACFGGTFTISNDRSRPLMTVGLL